MDWLKAIAPTVFSALGGPLAGLAVNAVGSALGLSEATKETVTEVLSSGQMTPEQIAGIRQAEINLKAEAQRLGIDFEKVAAADRADARQMQISNKSFMPAVLSTIVTVGYLGVLAGMMLGYLKTSDSQALLLMLGSLSTGWGVVLSFWFGTTRGSEDKTRLLAKAEPIK